MGEGEYRFIRRGQRAVETYQHWDNIPQDIAELISFKPQIPPEPHTPQEHEMIEALPTKMLEVMARCRR